ncbi:unnamed protein product [Amoebophrya sp. A25]|nr:unnamed protein product [Amoebophrya sp. A25]|eukprot:GSA25T00026986001.1
MKNENDGKFTMRTLSTSSGSRPRNNKTILAANEFVRLSLLSFLEIVTGIRKR